eukprot:m.178337 g.178337  ORF g.178337 m.178337 type:complete len:83 (-) comp14925_c0_seq4:604-852(-)
MFTSSNDKLCSAAWFSRSEVVIIVVSRRGGLVYGTTAWLFDTLDPQPILTERREWQLAQTTEVTFNLHGLKAPLRCPSTVLC